MIQDCVLRLGVKRAVTVNSKVLLNGLQTLKERIIHCVRSGICPYLKGSTIPKPWQRKGGALDNLGSHKGTSTPLPVYEND